MWDADRQFPGTDLTAYCRACRERGGCDACPQPQLLPECVPALAAWHVCETQWRVGFAGKVGLDYTACLAALNLYLPRWQAQAGQGEAIRAVTVVDLLDDVRTIEQTLLTVWAEKAEAETSQNRGKPE